MTDGLVQVSFADVEQAAVDINRMHTTMTNQLEDLKSKLHPIVTQWTGAASEQYQGAQARWNSAASDLAAVIAAIGSAVRQAGENYQSTELNALRLWDR